MEKVFGVQSIDNDFSETDPSDGKILYKFVAKLQKAKSHSQLDSKKSRSGLCGGHWGIDWFYWNITLWLQIIHHFVEKTTATLIVGSHISEILVVSGEKGIVLWGQLIFWF